MEKPMITKLSVISDAAAEDCNYVICMPYTPGDKPMMVGNLFGKCSKCDQDIQFRPHIPKKPPRICLACIPEVAKNHPEGIHGTVTAQVLKEVKERMES